MATRIEGKSAGHYGTTYTVQIDDSDFTGTKTDVSLGENGFTLAYKPDGDEHPHNPIISSECTFTIIRDQSNNSDIGSFVTNLIRSDEGRFRVKILDGSSSLYWCGYILADQVVEQDRDWADTISALTIRAKDGINRLKSVDYNDDGTAYTGRDTLKEHLFKILGKIDTADFFAASDEYLTVIAKWYDGTMDSPALTDDPLDLVFFDHFTATERDANGIISYRSSYEILKTICTIFGARFFFSDGSYRFEQVNEYKNTGSIYRHRYRKAGTKIGTSTSVELEASEADGDFIRASEGEYSYFAPLRRIELTFNHRNDYNYLEGETWDELNVSAVNVGNVGTQNIGFRIAGTIESKVDFDTDFLQCRNVFAIEVKLTFGATKYYLKRGYNLTSGGVTYNRGEWTTTASDRMLVVTPIQPANDIAILQTVDYITPDVPTDLEECQVEMGVNYNSTLLVSSQGNPIQTITIEWDYYNTIFQLFSEDDAALTEKTITTLNNPDSTNLSQVLEIETLIGDSPNLLTSATLTVEDAAGDLQPSDDWTRGLSGTGKKIQNLLLSQIMKYRKKALLKWRGTVFKTSGVHYNSVLWFSTGNKVVPLTASYNSKAEQWEGEWFLIDYELDSITEIPDDRHLGGNVTNIPLTTGDPSSNGVSFWDVAVDAVGSSYDAGGQIGSILDGSIIEGDVITSIPIQPIGVDGLINTGDIIALVSSNGTSQTFTASADVGPSDTSISVNSTTATSSFGTGNYVTISNSTYITNVQDGASGGGGGSTVERYKQVFDNVSSSTLTVTANGGTLPSNTDQIDVYYNGRLLVEGASKDYTVSGSDINLQFTPVGNPTVVVVFIVTPSDRYKQVFDNVSSSTLTVTANGGTLPSDTDQIDVYYNGRQLVEGASRDYTVSGSDINFTFTPAGGPTVVVAFLIIA